MANPSDGRVAVEVIVTSNRFTELTTGTRTMCDKRAFHVRSRVTINFWKDCHDMRVARRGSSRQGRVESRRRGDAQTQQTPVVLPKSLGRTDGPASACPMRARLQVPWLGLAAGSASVVLATLTYRLYA